MGWGIYPDAVEQAKKDGRNDLDAGDMFRVFASASLAAGVDTAGEAIMANRIFGRVADLAQDRWLAGPRVRPVRPAPRLSRPPLIWRRIAGWPGRTRGPRWYGP